MANPFDQFDAPPQQVSPNPFDQFDGADDGSAWENTKTGLLRIPGVVLGLPHALDHAKNWLLAKAGNAVTGGSITADQLDHTSVASVLPSQEGVDAAAFKLTGQTPYTPKTEAGRLGQAAITAGGAALVDPFALAGDAKGAATLIRGLIARGVKTAGAGGAAAGIYDATGNPAAAFVAGLLTHGGLSAAGPIAKSAYRNFAAPLLQPTKTAKLDLGSSVAGVDNSGAPIDLSSPTEQADAKAAAIGAGNDIQVGSQPYQSGEDLRGILQNRQDQLVADRAATADTNYGAFKAGPPMAVTRLQPFMNRPSFRRAMIDAGGSVLDEGGQPATQYWDVENAGAPNPDGVPGISFKTAALPPEMLDRIKQRLDANVQAAKTAPDRRTATILRDQFVGTLDGYYPNYAAARTDFANMSRPLDPLEQAPSGRVLATRGFGNAEEPTMPNEQVADAFLLGPTRSNMENLVAASGGDREKAMQVLEDHMANKVQDAINADGTIDRNRFAKLVKPYATAVNNWFPKLAQKFATADAAQATLDTVNARRQLATSVGNGEMRTPDGFVSGPSMLKWINNNRATLEKTQAKSGIMRLEQIAKSLPDTPGAGAGVTLEAAPMVAGGILGGLEGGVLGGITHNIPGYFGGPLLNRYRKVFSDMAERAVQDPQFTQSVINDAVKRGGTRSLADVLRGRTLSALRNGAQAGLSGGGDLPPPY